MSSLLQMTLKISAVVTSVLLVTGCEGPQPIPRPSGGYDAIKFRQTILIDNPFWSLTFPAGSVFVADRTIKNYGVAYCGNASDSTGRVLAICIGIEPPSTLVLGPGDFRGQRRYPQPPDVFERTKFNP